MVRRLALSAIGLAVACSSTAAPARSLSPLPSATPLVVPSAAALFVDPPRTPTPAPTPAPTPVHAPPPTSRPAPPPPTARPTPAPTPTPAPSPSIPPTWTLHSRRDFGFAIATPRNWIVLEIDPQKSAEKFVAEGPFAGGEREGYLPEVRVSRWTSAPAPSLDRLAAEVVAGIRSVPETISVTARRVDLPSGPAVEVRYSQRAPMLSGGTSTAAITGYWMVHDGIVYSVRLLSMLDAAAAYDGTFQQIAHSFAFR